VNLSGSVDWTLTSSGGPSGGAATLILHNNSGQTVCYVNISLSSADTWGDDWLGDTETIADGGSRTFSVPAGTYDLRALNCDGEEIDVEWGVQLSGTVDWWVP
jgi:hypothetical protein